MKDQVMKDFQPIVVIYEAVVPKPIRIALSSEVKKVVCSVSTSVKGGAAPMLKIVAR